MTDFTEGLNKEQKEAVLTTEGPLLITAGAGSGKTRVLTHRVAHLVKNNGISPENILAITFTNKAADEMQERLQALIGIDEANELTVSTFHSLCNIILRRNAKDAGLDNNFNILDGDDQKAIITQLIKEAFIDSRVYTPRDIMSIISNYKNNDITPAQAVFSASNPKEVNASLIYQKYSEYLQRINTVDFDDLLKITKKLFLENPNVLRYYQNKFQYIHVDEYQDTNTVQYEIVHMLADPQNNLCVVGDSDQAIYGWRGANIKNILDFTKDFPQATVIVLNQNYRSTPEILDVANDIISNNKGRDEKLLKTENAHDTQVHVKRFLGDKDEVRDVIKQIKELHKTYDYKDIAILYRTNGQSQPFEQALLENKIPYNLIGGLKFYERKEIKDIMAYLKALVNPANDTAIKRIINVPARGISDMTLDKVELFAKTNNISIYQSLRNEYIDSIPDLKPKAKEALILFRDMLKQFFEIYTKNDLKKIADLIDKIYQESGYKTMLQETKDSSSEERMENIELLIHTANGFENDIMSGKIEKHDDLLSDFLNTVALAQPLDNLTDADDKDSNSVKLMTLHSAKGLEFKNVFIVGMEEGIFPNKYTASLSETLEEERRLAYVGVTRAEKNLYISYAQNRFRYGQVIDTGRSRFIDEISDMHVLNLRK